MTPLKLRVIVFIAAAFSYIPYIASQIIAADSSNYVIHFYRPKAFLGSGSKIKVKLNSIEIGELPNGSSMNCKLFSEGVIEVEISSKRPYSTYKYSFEAVKGEEYNLKIFWPYANTVRLVPIEEENLAEIQNEGNYRPGFRPELVLEDESHPIPIKHQSLPEANKVVKRESKEPKTSGSAVAISNDGHLITNYHVIKGSDFVYVKGINGDFNKKYKVAVIVKDELNDLAIIKIDDENFTNWNDSIPYSIKTDLAEVGEGIYVLGYPLTTTMGDEIKLTNGIVSSKTGFMGNISLYQISAPVQPGNSGGPLFDNNGNLIGIVTAKHLEAENVSYAIKSNYLINLVGVMPQNLELPKVNQLKGLSLPEQVKKVKQFIVLVEVH